jgi:glycosyltransferase 2 family protein
VKQIRTDSPLQAPASTTARRAFRIALLLLPIGVLGNLAYMLLATDRALLDSLGSLPRSYLAVALALALTPWVTNTIRLFMWTRFLGYRIPLRDVVRMILVVDLGGAVAPTAVGGEAFKWGMMLRHGIRPGAAASLVLLPKLEEGFFFLFALPAAIIISNSWRLPVVANSLLVLRLNVVPMIATLVVLVIVARLLVVGAMQGHGGERMRAWTSARWERSRRKLRRTWREARAVFRVIARRGKRLLAVSLLLTALQWGARYSVISALALFLGFPFDPVLFWLLQWVVFTIMSFIPSPGATGAAEVAFTAVYAALLPQGVIGVATAAWRLFTFYVPVGLAALLFPLLGRRTATSHA